MVDDNESGSKRPSARKVPVDGRDELADDGGGDEVAARRPRRRQPVWRRGWFWVGVIVAEVVVVLVLSVAFERSTTEVDLAGFDTTTFCDQARTLREETANSAASAQPADVGDPTAIEQERDAYRSLVAVAPPALVADLERLAELDDDLIETVREIGVRKAEDPSYSGLSELNDELERVRVQGRVAAARLELVLRQECGIDVTATPTTTTLPVGPVAPGTTGS